MSSPEKGCCLVSRSDLEQYTCASTIPWEGVREMYQIVSLISLMFLTWAAAIWASYGEDKL